MNKILKFPVLCLAMAAVVFASCNKDIDTPVVPEETGGEIVLGVGDGFEAIVDTKGTNITTVPTTLYWGATTGGNAAGSTAETVKWATASSSVSSGKINTGKYQTATPTAYTYYVANQTFTAGGAMTVANNNTDILVGRTFGTTSSTPSVALDHIFAALGTLSVTAKSGYTVSNVTWKFVSPSSSATGTAGTYNVRTKAWSSTTALAETTVASGSNLYLIPGTYTVKVTFTLTKGDWTQNYTKTASVALQAGKTNNITANMTSIDPASPITLNITLNAWGSVDHSPTWN